MLMKCAECGWHGDLEEIKVGLADLEDTVPLLVPGAVVPHGACPSCGKATVFEDKDTGPVSRQMNPKEVQGLVRRLNAVAGQCERLRTKIRQQEGKWTYEAEAIGEVEGEVRAAYLDLMMLTDTMDAITY